MKIKILTVLGLYLLLTISSLFAGDMKAADYANKYYKIWNMPGAGGDDGASDLMSSFYAKVPHALQGEVLDEIFNRACSAQPEAYRVMSYVFMCLRNFGSEVTLPERFDKNLYAVAKDSNPRARRDVVEVLGNLKRSKDGNVIQVALNDKNEEVRAAAITALSAQVGSEAILQKFIQNHRSDPTYATSIACAEAAISGMHQVQTKNEATNAGGMPTKQ